MLENKLAIAMFALLLNDWEGDNISSFQRTEAKENESIFLWLSWDIPQGAQRTHSLFEGDNRLMSTNTVVSFFNETNSTNKISDVGENNIMKCDPVQSGKVLNLILWLS